MLKRVGMAVVLVAGLAVPAGATTLTYLITGVVNAGFPGVGLQEMTATLTVDLSTPGDSYYAGAVVSAFFTIGGVSAGSAASLDVQIIDDQTQDVLGIGSGPGAVLSGDYQGAPLYGVIIRLQDNQQNAFSSTALQIPTDISAFEYTTFYLYFATSPIQINGTVTSIQLVPEPTIAALLGVGTLAGIGVRRRRS